MIKRLYIDNYRCFRNFELKLGAIPCAMLIGANGVGKSTIGEILAAFRKLGEGAVRVNDVFPPGVKSEIGVPGEPKSDAVRIELDVASDKHSWAYGLTLSLQGNEFKVAEEMLVCDGRPLVNRAGLRVRDDVLALGCFLDSSDEQEVAEFLKVLASILVIRPVPSKMSGSLHGKANHLSEDCCNFSDWFAVHISGGMAAYEAFHDYMKCVMADFAGVETDERGARGPMLKICFDAPEKDLRMKIPLGALSDGEKCQLIAASVVALNETMPNLTVFWDEPDNFITTGEVAYLMPALCHSFVKRGQLIVSSHSREAILTYGENEVLCLRRAAHGLPVKQPISIAELRANGTFTGSLDQVLRTGEVVAAWD